MAGGAVSEVIGLGLRATATLAAFEALAERLGAPPDCPVALPEFRADLPLARALRQAGRALLLIPRARLQGVLTPSQSPRSLAHYGTGSVAEACALLALAPARLLAPALTSSDRRLTAALARRCDGASTISLCERPLP